MTTNPPPKNGLKVKFVRQKDDTTCGAASAVMVLDAIGVHHPNQSDLFKEIHSFKTSDRGKKKWQSSPDGLKSKLNKYSKPNYCFKIYANTNLSGTSKRIVWTLINYKTPCIALIDSGGHWVVVYQHDLPGGEIPASYNAFSIAGLLTLYMINPLHDTPSEWPVNYGVWLTDTYPVKTGKWRNDYVVLCDPKPDDEKKRKGMFSNSKIPSGKDPKIFFNETNSLSAADPKSPYSAAKPKKGKLKNDDPSLEKRTGIKITRIKEPNPGAKLVNDDTAKQYSMWHLKNDGFYNPSKFTRMMISPTAGKPMLVRALDNDDYWYIVPFIEPNNKMGGMMRLNAKEPTFQEGSFAMYADQPLSLPRLSDKHIKQIVIDKYGKTKGEITIEPVLVWKPCVQSYSRFLPFYLVKRGTRTVYIRIDGKPYARLSQSRRL